jgi:hypothetical protein
VLAGLSAPIQGVHLRKKAAVFVEASNSRNPHLGISYKDLDQLENEATP